MPVDPVIQSLIDLVEPPEDGHRAGGTSDFAADRSTGTRPHVGFDMNRGHGVLPHGRVTSPVYGRIKQVDPARGRIVIEERDPAGKLTGYDVEILHTQTQSVTPKDEVAPGQQIGTQGDVGAPGAFHAHIQVFRGDRTPLNPLRHLFEYHHPGEPVPPLPQFEPRQVPPRGQAGLAQRPADQGPPAPAGAPGSPLAGATPTQAAPGTAIPDAEGPTSIGGPAGPRPLMPPARARSQVPANPAPAVDSLPPLHFAPEAPRNFRPFAVPGPFRADAFGGLGAASTASGMSAPGLPAPSLGAPHGSPEATLPAVLRPDPIGDGNGIGDWWDSVASASPDSARAPIRRLSTVLPGTAQPDSSSSAALLRASAHEGNAGGRSISTSLPTARFPLEALFASDPKGALDQWASSSPRRSAPAPKRDAAAVLAGRSVAAVDPSSPDQAPAGGLLGMIQDYMRNIGY